MATQEEGHAEALRRMEQQATPRSSCHLKISSTREYAYVGPVEPGHAKVQELATEVVEQQSAFQVQSLDVTKRCSVLCQSLALRLRGASLNNVCATGVFYPPAQC